ncbi:MAG: HAD family phosphatase [Clostridiales bacterium]|nr:HAD family phosphatase [Clostridiales bacterium]
MYKAILFDMDGVLLDTEEQAYEIWRDYLQKNAAYDLDRELYAQVGGSPPDEFDRFMAEHLPCDPDGLRRYWGEETQRLIDLGEVRTLPGFENLLRFLAGYSGKKAVVTSNGSAWMEGYAQLFRLRERFDGVYTGDLVVNRKPAPDLYLHACRELGVNPAECLAVEDSASGITAALRAGISVAHMHGISAVPQEMLQQCDYHVRDLNDVIGILKKQAPDA